MLGPPMSMFSMSVSKLRAGLRERLLERVEVDDHEVDEARAEALEIGVVEAVAREDAAVDARVERLHAAAHHLRRAGVALDALDRDAARLERAVGAAGGNEDDVPRDERLGEGDETGLVGNGKNRRAYRH